MTSKLTICALALSSVLAGCGQQEVTVSTCPSESEVVFNTIASRRSVRAYKPNPVGRDTVEALLKVAIQAPSAINKQPWEIRVVDNQAGLDSITKIFKAIDPRGEEMGGKRNMFRDAPTVIFIAGDTTNVYHRCDCGILSQTLMLAAQSMGLGTCVQAFPARFIADTPQAKGFRDALLFSPNYKLYLCVALGHPDEAPAAKDRDASKIKFIE